MKGLVDSIVDRTPDTDTVQVAATMAIALGFGVLAVFVSLWSVGTIWHGLLWAGAWSSVGWFLGFLFGIPRSLSTDEARVSGRSISNPAQRELDGAKTTASELREAAGQALNAKTDAEGRASETLQHVDEAAMAYEAASAKLAADPEKSALKAEVDEKAAAAESAKLTNDKAAQAAKDAKDKGRQSEQAAEKAEAAVQAIENKMAADHANLSKAPAPSLSVNTNLEQISDWLTKIIVGVSLVESQTLLDKMQKVATFMANSMVKANDTVARVVTESDSIAASPVAAASGAASAAAASVTSANVSVSSFAAAESFAYAIMLYFLVTGLLGSYLLTRLFLQRALDRAAYALHRS